MTESPEALHLLAHRAQQRARTATDWWTSPLDTALAAVSAVRHPPAHRQDAERAVARLRRWRDDGEPRRVSGDVAALALAASAARDLGHRDPDLDSAAVEGLADLAQRTDAAAPILHVALAVWGLDRVVSDRHARPWPEVRARVSGEALRHGVDRALAEYVGAVAGVAFNAQALVRQLLSSVPTSPGANDGAVVLWLLTAAIERCAPVLSPADAGFQALADRRAELATRLAMEVDADAFNEPEVADFDPEGELDLRPVLYLSPMEALLLDLSLTSAAPEKAWLRFDEAEMVFGRAALEAAARHAKVTAALVGALGAAVGTLVSGSLLTADVEGSVAIQAGVVVFALLAALASAILHRSEPSAPVQAAGMLFSLLAVGAAVSGANQALSSPVLSDAAGLVAALLVGAAGPLIWAALTRRQAR